MWGSPRDRRCGRQRVKRAGDIVFTAIDSSGHTTIWRGNSQGANLRQITKGPEDERPSCSPDGKFVVYQDASFAPEKLMKIDAEGGAATQIGTEHLEYPVISPDGRSVAGRYAPGPDKPMTLATVGIDSGEVQNTYTLPQGANLGDEAGAKVAWAKDGQSILFLVNERGRK